jgi:hypothetical protein
MLLLADYCRGLGSYAEANYALMKAHFQVRNNCALLASVYAESCSSNLKPFAARLLCSETSVHVRGWLLTLGPLLATSWSTLGPASNSSYLNLMRAFRRGHFGECAQCVTVLFGICIV